MTLAACKPPEAFVGAQQKNRTCGFSESFMRGGVLFAFIFCPNDQQNGFHAPKTQGGLGEVETPQRRGS